MMTGDHISVCMGHYRHHGIYVGGGQVVHLRKATTCVELTSVEEFTEGRAITTHASGGFTAAIRALRRVGEWGYDLIVKNCEHLCHWAVNGSHWSPQVSARLTGAAFGAGAGLAAAAALGLGPVAFVALPIAAAAGCAYFAVQVWNWVSHLFSDFLGFVFG